MSNYQPREYPIFKRMDENIIAGISSQTILLVLLGAVFGIVLYIGLGFITTNQTKEYSYTEQTDVLVEYESMYDALYYFDLKEKQASTNDEAALSNIELELDVITQSTLQDLSESEIQDLATKATEIGITLDMTTEELNSLVPTTYEAQVPIVNDYHRLVLAVLPALIIGAFRYESNGVSIQRYLQNSIEYSRSQKEYFYRS